MQSRNQVGTILVIVMLWLALMVLLVLIGLSNAQRQLRLVGYHVSRVQAQMLAELGLAAARAQLLHGSLHGLLHGANVQWSIELIDDNLDAGKTYLLTSNAQYRQARARMREKVRLITLRCVANKSCQPPRLVRLWWKEPKRNE